MAAELYISYLRVSTSKQGRSGLGLAAQREMVEAYVRSGDRRIVRELVEIESGRKDDRPRLAEALRLCRLHGARLLVGKLDRLSRDAAFLLNLQKSAVKFVVADTPDANELTIGVLAVVAQAERQMIADRTRQALARKRAWYASLTDEQRQALVDAGKPISLGGRRSTTITPEARRRGQEARSARAQARAADLGPILADLRKQGVVSLYGLARALSQASIPTPRGKAEWSARQVARVLEQIG